MEVQALCISFGLYCLWDTPMTMVARQLPCASGLSLQQPCQPGMACVPLSVLVCSWLEAQNLSGSFIKMLPQFCPSSGFQSLQPPTPAFSCSLLPLEIGLSPWGPRDDGGLVPRACLPVQAGWGRRSPAEPGVCAVEGVQGQPRGGPGEAHPEKGTVSEIHWLSGGIFCLFW